MLTNIEIRNSQDQLLYVINTNLKINIQTKSNCLELYNCLLNLLKHYLNIHQDENTIHSNIDELIKILSDIKLFRKQTNYVIV